MAKLPKSIIKKYGISKKAWAVFRGTSQRIKTTSRSINLARKRSFRRASSGSGGMLNNALKGAGAAAVTKRFLGNNDLIALVAAGYVGGMGGVVGAVLTGQAAIPNLGGILGGTSSGNGGWN